MDLYFIEYGEALSVDKVVQDWDFVRSGLYCLPNWALEIIC